MKSYINPKTNRQIVVYHCECGKKEFKTAYSQLCDNCELKPLIKDGIKNQIVLEAKIKRDILTDKQFTDYINNEIDNANKEITNRLLNQRQQKTIDVKNDYVGSRIMGVVWNSERIKALNEFLNNNKTSNGEQNPHPRFFTSLIAFKIFEEFKNTIENPLADYSFIYRIMLKDGLIYDSIGDSEYRKWLSSTYQIEIEKTKQFNRCSTISKKQLYSSIKSNIK
ncbi:hypothetical protein [Tenacibaculum maritimum]|uniref:hypothetical protein n=1 Tax=Tenacibaculum maritimum TaxID=107401 RepID=UPI0038767AC5